MISYQPLIQYVACKYFLPPYVAFSFFYLIYFTVQKFLVWYSHSYLFLLLLLVLYVSYAKKKIIARTFCLCFLLGVLCFHVLHLFKSLIHFELIVSSIRGESSFILLHVNIQFPSTIYWRDCLYWAFLALFSSINWPWMYGFISGLSILSHWSMCLVLCWYHTLLIPIAL